jgi:hypothetical protein
LAVEIDYRSPALALLPPQSMANGNTKDGSLGKLPENALVILDASGQIVTPTRCGFDHFK